MTHYRTQYSRWAIETRYTQLVSVAFPYLFAIWKFTIWKRKFLRWLYHSMILSPLLKFFLIWAMRLFQNVFLSGKCNIPLFHRWFLLKLMVQIPCLVSKQVGHWPKMDYNFFSSLNSFPSLLEYKQIFFVLI